MMVYYDEGKEEFYVDGVRTMLTEEHAERLACEGYDVQPTFDLEDAIEGLADEYLDCTCPDDLPDGRSRGFCPYCKLLVEEDTEIPYK
jgi:hypothetical protein